MAAVGERVELTIDDLDHKGQGVARLDGQVVFVEGGLPGDLVLCRLVATSRRHLVGRLEQVLRPSASRRRAPCILADHCGGCSLQALNDGAEQAWKQRMVQQTLRRLAGMEVPLRPLLAAKEGLGYRNRAVIPLEWGPDGKLRAGYYRRGSHRIVNMNRCPVLDPRLDGLIAPLKADLAGTGWPVDRHGSRGGGLRHLALRLGVHTGELLITLISSQGDLPGLEDLAESWMARWPALVGVALNLQEAPTNLLMGPQTRAIHGRAWLLERFAGLTYRIGADTFFQVHTRQAERVVPLLREALCDVAPGGRLVDAYCGIGTFSLPLAATGWRVLGIEQHPGAVTLARHNAHANGLEERADFVEGAVTEVLAEALVAADALFVDPPRKGLDPLSLEAIRAVPPERLLYLSCDPATLARDLGHLCGEGPYRLRWAQSIDFFPNTTHVETLAVLEHSH